MFQVAVTHIANAFGETQAVADVSFGVEQGEISGLLGPNGAGKTTTIRLMLDIFRPDRGAVSILGGPDYVANGCGLPAEHDHHR